MAKLRFDKDAIQGFFFNHTEKLVLGLVLVLLVLFIYAGSGIAGLDSSKTPDALKQRVETAKTHIATTKKETLQSKVEYAPVENHKVRVELATQPTVADPYALDTPTTIVKEYIRHRTDPEIFAPLKPEATVMTLGLALTLAKEKTYSYDALTNMPQKTIEVTKKATRPKGKKKKKDDDDNMMSSDAMMKAMGGGEEEDKGKSMDSRKMMGSMGGNMGGGGATASGDAVMANEERFVGYRPKAAAGTAGSRVVAKSLNVVSLRWVYPVRQQWDEFERVFSNAEGINPQRDVPRYLSFRAQRAIAPTDPNEEPKWEPVNKWFWTEAEIKKPTQYRFAGAPGEIADLRYLHPNLTMPLPPAMNRDISKLALHELVPMRKITKKETSIKKSDDAGTIDPSEIGSEGGAPGAPGGPGTTNPGTTGPGGMGGAAMGSAMMGKGMGGDTAGSSSSMMSGGSSMPSGGSSMMSGGSSMMSGGSSMMSGGSSMMSGGSSMMSGGGMPGAAAGGMISASGGPQAEFAMIRFFDYIGTGTKYIYRVQVLIEDPNHPENAQSAPHDSILDQTVRERLVKVAAEERASSRRKFYLTSAWSEPTAPVSVQAARHTYAGGATQPERTLPIKTAVGGKTGYTVPAEGEPTAQVMSVAWNTKYAVDLPGLVDASRGSWLNLVTSVDIIEPVTLIYKTIQEYRVSSNKLVVDLRGGQVLPDPNAGAMPLRAPGEVVMFDTTTDSLIVRNELDDFEAFDQLAPPPPVIVETSSSKATDDDDAMKAFGGFGDL